MAIIILPLARSFAPQLAFYKSFKNLALAMALVSGVFIIWDIIFVNLGFWGFNESYHSGIGLFGLPIGAWLFFITVPFAYIFIYRVLNHAVKRDILEKQSKNISNFLIGFSFALAAIYYDRWYTVITFVLLGSLVAFVHYRAKPIWLSRFYLAFAVSLLPLLIVNGVLTGAFTLGEAIWYNPEEIIGTRIGTIPLENIFYGLLLLLGTTYFYEVFGNAASNQTTD